MPVLALVLSELAGAYFNPSAAAMKAGVTCLLSVAQDRLFLLHSSQCLLTSLPEQRRHGIQPVLQTFTGASTEMHVGRLPSAA